MRNRLAGIFGQVRAQAQELPRLGQAGSRSAALHDDPISHPTPPRGRLSPAELRRFYLLRWLGATGSLMAALGALGAGALPVVGNPYHLLPGGTLMFRMLQTSSVVVMVGVGLIVLAWILMAPFVGAVHGSRSGTASTAMLVRTFAVWVAPLLFTAPLFTQDIYSYLAQGSIVAQGMDPYSAGPVELLGTENDLARSVPFIWSNSPSPYGPVALWLASMISRLTSDSIILGVIGHRFASLLGLIAAGWAVNRLAKRCLVNPSAALWLGIINPLTILHLIAGIHNEAILLGFMLVGLELGLRGVDMLGGRRGHEVEVRRGLALLISSGALISCAGMVKVTGFLALGFVGMNLARHFFRTGRGRVSAIALAVLFQIAVLVFAIALVSLATGISLGWITGQGGAATIRSWMSITTDIGVITGWLGILLGLGDHTSAILTITRTAGILVATGFLVRMLFATFKGRIHPVGGLGVATFVLVILFPVIHPWYMLWAIVPLAAWANRTLFRVAVVIYSSAMSFFVLPRGLALPPSTVFEIYASSLLAFLCILGFGWWLLKSRRLRVLN